MALIDTSFHHVDRQHIGNTSKAESSHISSIASDKSEDKSSYLKNDLVTLSNKEDEGSQNQFFSHNRHQAIAAYKAFSKTFANESAEAEDPFEKKHVDFPEEISDQSDDDNAAVKDPVKEAVKQSKGEDSDSSKEESVSEKKTDKDNDRKSNGEQLTDAEQKKVNQMKERDTEVRTHEMAHARVGGQYAGAPVYEKEKGPDGKDYITDGHVNIDMSEESTASKTVQKMQQVIRAAKAPAEPSGQDLKVAAEAQQKLNEASRKVLEENNPAKKQADKSDINTASEHKQSDKADDSIKPADNNNDAISTGNDQKNTHKMDFAST